ncbi:MAG TPA: serine/threonine-protein kinase [Candidatus Dormibacteraeota bacterium]|nr:serine/threonine-protein kinase [Candidatus Dormibacteraeota bacterium]
MAHHEREIEVFEAALELPSGEREAFVEQASAGDPEFLKRIRALLDAAEDGADFLTPLTPNPGQPLPAIEKPGDRIGRYKLLEQIGEGGCGVVYMAEQEEPIRRKVALKVIKLGMDTRQVVARFEAERQALALMDHPNIAKVYDAGATTTGRPFFVMELVRGVRITDYCNEKRLATAQRLELFNQVCQAVQHAHQKGIIHRDLKPSNILVTVNDGQAVPKVIDFGIAKATSGERLTDKTVFTAFHQFMGTPAYMSPEQAELTSVDIDTRSDVYTLGVLLYELLTGQTPFDASELLEAGLEEMRRTLREKEPARPSTRLSTLGAEKLRATAGLQGLEPPKLISLVRGDLDWIVLKCLEKDRARRYQTANALLTDIQRHLSNEPVSARPRSRLYEFQRTIRRHKLGFAAGVVVMMTLFLALGISTWSLAKEKRARHRADLEAAKSSQTARFLEDMLRGIDPKTAQERDTTLLRDLLGRSATRVSEDLTNQPLVEAHLENTIGNIYAALGEFETAEQMARNALALRRSEASGQPADLAESLFDLAHHLWSQGKLSEAEQFAREGLNTATNLVTNIPGKKDALVAKSLAQLGVIVQDQGKLGEAEDLFRQSLAVRKQVPGQDHPAVAQTLNTLSGVLTLEGKLGEAETANRDALKVFGFSFQQSDADALYNRGNTLFDRGRLTQAEACFRQALALRRKRSGEGPDVEVALSSLATTLRHQQRFAEAEPLYRECLASREKNCPNAWYTHYTRLLLGATLMGKRKFEEAEPLLISGYEGMRERESSIRDRTKVLVESLQTFIQLFEATARPQKADEWRGKLSAVQASGPRSKPVWPEFSSKDNEAASEP